jgi:hypothetical protein
MTAETRPLAEVTQDAIRVLLRELGVVNTLRFLKQYTTGYGDYTAERDQLFGEMTVAEIVAEIKEEREQGGRQGEWLLSFMFPPGRANRVVTVVTRGSKGRLPHHILLRPAAVIKAGEDGGIDQTGDEAALQTELLEAIGDQIEVARIR